MKRKLMFCIVAATALLAACGGGGGGDDAASELTMVPDEAVATSDAFSSWVGARQPSDTKDPLAMNAAMPPSSETAEPVDID
jgi:hypothetical protein